MITIRAERDWDGMQIGEQARDVLSAVDDVEPSADLWDRLAHSIRDDVARRRRRRLLAIGLAVLAGLVALLAVDVGLPGAAVVDWRAMEVAEAVLMLAVVVGLRPLLHEAGRGFVTEAFAGDEAAGQRFNVVLDLAWTLIFVGWILVTAEWTPTTAVGHHLGHQLAQLARRLAGLGLAMGLLHGLTFLVLPVVGLFWTAARRRRPVPRWVVVLVALGFVPVALVVLQLVAGILLAGAAGG